MSVDPAIAEGFDQILERIIDEWYDNVSSYYVTKEQIEAGECPGQEEELKRFHDEKGHRIKFAKDELDFTYGLRGRPDGEDYVIEISVNNKVRNFNHADFQTRLVQHYAKNARGYVTTPYDMKSNRYGDIFEFRPSLKEAFTVEKSSETTDIMRLSFWIESRFLRRLSSHPVAGKQLVEQYCISPFRSVYAAVYRRSR